jgi:exonuclease SbcD
MESLATAFRPDRISVLMAHVLVNNALIGAGGGARPLHLDMGIYGINPERIPTQAQYAALGHVHKPQDIRLSPRASYSGSLLQLDFGEAEQDKSVSLVELHAGRPAEVARLPITAGRRLCDIGSPAHGVAVDDLAGYAAEVGDAWLRVFVDVDTPLADLAARVREQLPNAVHVQRVTPGAAGEINSGSLTSAGKPPRELFRGFYESKAGRGQAALEPTMRLFDQLMDEAGNAPG